MASKQEWQKMARAAKRQGMDLERVAPDKEPFRSIFVAEYERFTPRKKTVDPHV